MICLPDSRVDGGLPLCQSDFFTDHIIVEKSRCFCTWYYLSGVTGKFSREGAWGTVPDFHSPKSWVPLDLSDQLLCLYKDIILDLGVTTLSLDDVH